MQGKRTIVFSYPAMMLGGSTTSLLSILRYIDYTRYEVDLLLEKNVGPWLNQVPEDVNILPPAHLYTEKRKHAIRALLSPRYVITYVWSKVIALKKQNSYQGAQYFEEKDVEFYRQLDKEYDVAIAFLEGRTCKYVARHITAKRKIAWIHIDYARSAFDPRYDLESMRQFDQIVLVSQKCRDSFCECFPGLREKTIVIENILLKETIKKMAEETSSLQVEQDKINLVTTCRIAFESKGLDRAVEAMARLKREGYLEKVRWYILGTGPDKDKLEKLIKDYGLSKNIILLGMKKNPYKYLKHMTIFFLPSRWEGKPMAVTEAYLMNLPVMVTEYTSAHEQVRHLVDGFVMQNNTQGIYEGLLYVIKNSDKIEMWKKCVCETDYSNICEMDKIIEMLG